MSDEQRLLIFQMIDLETSDFVRQLCAAGGVSHEEFMDYFAGKIADGVSTSENRLQDKSD